MNEQAGLRPTPVAAPPIRARIVATLGPASNCPEVITRLIQAGVSVFRLNFSHGSFEEHEQTLTAVRQAAAAVGQPVAVMGDLQGPKIRVGKIHGEVLLQRGQDVLICPGEPNQVVAGAGAGRDGAAISLPCTYEPIGREVKPGHRVLINDGAVRLLAVNDEAGDPAGSLRARVLVGGPVTSGKGINLPDSHISAPSVTEKDWLCVEWAVRHGLDFLALSFVRRAEEVRELRKALAGMCSIDHGVGAVGQGAMIPVVAKIEKPQALAHIDEILEAADAIMVARGDLGVEMDLASVPIAQKRLVERADAWGKPCIVATQMLESMITSAVPTRAEASDVANAVLDGADAVMLSGETAVGRHPALVVETMRRIIVATEERLAELITGPTPPGKVLESRYRTAALAHGAWHVAQDIGARLVVVWSQHGGGARYLSQTGFAIPIVAYSSEEQQTRRMGLLKGVTSMHIADLTGDDDAKLAAWNRRVDRDLLERGWAERGDPIVLIAGRPLGESGSTNMIAIHYVGNPSTGFMRHGHAAV